MKLATAAAWFLTITTISSAANADDVDRNCIDLIRASTQRDIIIESRDRAEAFARDFCKEHYQNQSSNKSSEYQAAYSGLSIGFGASGASEATVASRYCDKRQSEFLAKDVYQRYIDVVAPGAFDAYKVCVQNGRQGLLYDPNYVKSRDLSIHVKYSSQVQGPIKLIYSTSSDVSCRLIKDGLSINVDFLPGESNAIKLAAPGTAHLKCTRDSPDHDGTVNILAPTTSYDTLTVQWLKFIDDVPVNTINSLNNLINNFMASMKGAVVAFNSDRCPDGSWEEYRPAYGRFLRGIDKDNPPKTDPDKLRVAGSTQEDMIRRHAHNIRTDHAFGPQDGPNYRFTYGSSHDEEKQDIGFEGGDETRPKNVAVLFCIKK